MRTPVVIEPEIGTEGGRPARRADVGKPIGPLAQQRLDEALGLAIGLRSVRARETMADGPRATDLRKDAGAIGEPVVTEESADADAASSIPGTRPAQKRGTADGIFGGADFDVGQSGGVIDRHVEPLVANPAGPRSPIAVDAMSHAVNAAEPLHVDVQQVAGLSPFVALCGSERFAGRDAVQADARQHSGHGGARDAQGRTDLPRRRARPSQRDDRRFGRDACAARLAHGP